ncbi:hypothetical protein [Pseudoalteromonas pernae]|uniref:hypothetical protein n=1 Tax=Pseudoalteromonas pernae TaxID=3118054 RepID=UPI003241E302
MINSLLVTINQLLPLAVLCVFARCLCKCPPARNQWPWVLGAVLAPTFVYIQSMQSISQWFDYLGFEYSQMLLIVVMALCAIVGLALRHWAAFVLLIASALGLYASHYLPWLMQGELDAARGLGVFLGVGIVTSFSILFFFFLDWLEVRYGQFAVVLLFSMHIAGSMVAMLDIAAGAGVLTMPTAFFDLRFVLDEHSVLGRLAKVVVGYEATPSSLSSVVYMSTLLSLIAAARWQRSLQ